MLMGLEGVRYSAKEARIAIRWNIGTNVDGS